MATFKQLLTSIARSGKAVRDNVQKAVVMALAHFEQHGDTKYLTDLMEVAIGCRSIRTNTLKEFIKAHANVSWGKDKSGENMVFKKVGKEVNVKEVTTRWYDFNLDGQAKPDLDITTAIKSMITRISNAIDNGTLKEGQEEQARRVLEANQALLDA